LADQGGIVTDAFTDGPDKDAAVRVRDAIVAVQVVQCKRICEECTGDDFILNGEVRHLFMITGIVRRKKRMPAKTLCVISDGTGAMLVQQFIADHPDDEEVSKRQPDQGEYAVAIGRLSRTDGVMNAFHVAVAEANQVMHNQIAVTLVYERHQAPLLVPAIPRAGATPGPQAQRSQSGYPQRQQQPGYLAQAPYPQSSARPQQEPPSAYAQQAPYLQSPRYPQQAPSAYPQAPYLPSSGYPQGTPARPPQGEAGPPQQMRAAAPTSHVEEAKAAIEEEWARRSGRGDAVNANELKEFIGRRFGADDISAAMQEGATLT
jgi:hypothetical protein